MSNQMKIKVENKRVLTESILNGIDTSNLLASYGPGYNTKYTATEDSIVCVYVYAAYLGDIYVDDIPIVGSGNYSTSCYYTVPIKAGQVYDHNHGSGGNAGFVAYKAWGIKR